MDYIWLIIVIVIIIIITLYVLKGRHGCFPLC